MLNLRIVEVYNSLVVYLPIGSFLGIFFFLEVLYIIKLDLNFFSSYYFDVSNYESWLINYQSKSNIYLLAIILYNYYYYYLIFAALLLLLAMIGAIILTIDFSYWVSSRKKQNMYFNSRFLKKRISFWQVYKNK